MGKKIGFAAAVLAAVAFLVWHPHPPVVQSVTAPPPPAPSASIETTVSNARSRHRFSRYSSNDELVVYVAGAVKRPGLYRLHPGDRAARALDLAGGFSAAADASAVNLAARAADGDEIYVPAAGEALRVHATSQRHGRRHARTPPRASVDVNRAGTAELAAVPGIGRAIAQRIVELRSREGSFASLDQLLDVAGMTQTRLDRALPFLQQP